MIPKIIHYCWFGPNSQTEVVRKCIETWKVYLPDYNIVLWNESNSPMDNPYVKKMYRERKWAFVSDYVRLHALYQEGGIYLDTDMEILRSLDKFLKYESFLGFEDERFVSAGIIGSVKDGAFIKNCIGKYDNLRDTVNIPRILTAVLVESGLREYGEQTVGGTKLFCQEVFYPWPYGREFSTGMITDRSYAVHHWEHSWKLTRWEKSKRRFRDLLRRKKHTVWF